MMIALAILALGLLIVVHEAGHYYVARWSKMRVERFSIGFGPALIKWQHKGTQFQIAPIPFGGFVQITGMNPHEEFDEKDPTVYPNRPALLRFLTIFAGPGMNYLFAMVVVFGVYLVAGVRTGTEWARVKGVNDDSPAAGQLEPGDRLVAVNGVKVFISHAKDDKAPYFQSEVQKAKGAPMRVTVLRAGREQDVEIIAKPVARTTMKSAMTRATEAVTKGSVGQPLSPPVMSYMVGIALEVDPERADVGLGRAALEAGKYPAVMTKNILTGLYMAIRGEVEAEVSSAIGIVDQMQTVFKLGWTDALEFLAALSLYLGLFNLLPIPGLDGGRLAFLTYELATRRRPNPRVEATVHMVGFVLLFLLVIVVTFKDIGKAVSKAFT